MMNTLKYHRIRQAGTRSLTICLAFLVLTTLIMNANSFSPSFQSTNFVTRQSLSRNPRNHHFSTSSETSESTTADPSSPALGAPICVYHQVDVPSSEANPVPRQAVSVEDLTPTLQQLLAESGMQQGLITVISRHTTTSLTINEWESRLADDIADSLLKLMPPDERSSSPAAIQGVTYKHNDIDLRPFGEADNRDSEEAQRCRENGWNVDDPNELRAWQDQEPINAHSHLLSILAGSASESIPVVDGKMVLGQWQSVLLLDLDGPRDRTVGVQLMGYT